MLNTASCSAGQEPPPWPAPRALSGALAPVGPFEPELLPESLRALVVDVAERLQVPLDYPAAAVLVMLAGALGRRALIHPQRYDHHWTVIPNLWGAIVGRSGVMKSAVLRAVLRPLRRRQALALTVYECEREAYQCQLQKEAAQKRMRRVSRAVATQEEGACWEPQPPPSPVCTRYVINEATIEKLQVILKENPQGVLYLRDELSGWWAQLEQRGRQPERAFVLETWDGDGDFTFDRVGRGTVYARHLCLSVFGGLQPARLQQYLAEAVSGGAGDDGLAQRFQLLVWPDLSRDWQDMDRAPQQSDGRADRRNSGAAPADLAGGSLSDSFRCRGARTL